MTALKCLCLIAVVVAFTGWEASLFAEDDVTVIPTSTATTSPTQKTLDSDGTPVVHKSLHKKKHAIASSTQPSAVAATNLPAINPAASSDPAPSTPVVNAGPLAPAVETGLPVARYPGMGSPIQGVSTYIPGSTTLTTTKNGSTSVTRPPLFADGFPSPVIPLTSTAAGSFSSPSRTANSSSDFVFVNFPKKVKNSYPWKTKIITTEFWIGEGSTPMSSTTNLASAWDLDWRSSNSGTDSPNDRNGYASARHAATVNPFYVALPFNDLAFPDKAREWLPRGWYRHPRYGKQVSACKDRWVEIKNAQGDVCYAQWEDVGPLRYDHAEYVFGDERPTGLGDDHAGLDVSPAVADYLNLNDRNRYTSWRFVDDEDVKPGAWLKLDEQAVLYRALHELKNSSLSDLPIQRATEPIEDSSNINSNKKKVDASKG